MAEAPSTEGVQQKPKKRVVKKIIVRRVVKRSHSNNSADSSADTTHSTSEASSGAAKKGLAEKEKEAQPLLPEEWRVEGWNAIRRPKQWFMRGKWEEKHPVFRAVLKGDAAKLEEKAAKKRKSFDVNYRCKHSGVSALELALLTGTEENGWNMAVVAALLRLGADVNGTVGVEGTRSSLSTALATNNVPLLEMLSTAGADWKGVPEGDPPINRAAAYLSLAAIVWLVEYHAVSVTQFTEEHASSLLLASLGSRTGLYHAEGWCKDEVDNSLRMVTIRFLLKQGADPHAVDRAGWNWAMAATRVGPIENLFLAHQHRVEVSGLRDSSGWSSLHIAMQYAPPDCVRWLLEYFSWDLNQPLGNGQTMLHLGARVDAVESVALVIDRGARIDAQLPKEAHQLTPLYLALGCRSSSPLMVAVLLLGGASTTIKCGKMKDALRCLGSLDDGKDHSEEAKILRKEKKKALAIGAHVAEAVVELHLKKEEWASRRLVVGTHGMLLETRPGAATATEYSDITSCDHETFIDRVHCLSIEAHTKRHAKRKYVISFDSAAIQETYYGLMTDGAKRTAKSRAKIAELCRCVPLWAKDGSKILRSPDPLPEWAKSYKHETRQPTALELGSSMRIALQLDDNVCARCDFRPATELCHTCQSQVCNDAACSGWFLTQEGQPEQLLCIPCATELQRQASGALPGGAGKKSARSHRRAKSVSGNMCVACQARKGNYKKCSECEEKVCKSPKCGGLYLLSSLGETEKRFVCALCIPELRTRSHGHMAEAAAAADGDSSVVGVGEEESVQPRRLSLVITPRLFDPNQLTSPRGESLSPRGASSGGPALSPRKREKKEKKRHGRKKRAESPLISSPVMVDEAPQHESLVDSDYCLVQKEFVQVGGSTASLKAGVGDVIQVQEKYPTGMWKGRNLKNGDEGVFDSSVVVMCNAKGEALENYHDKVKVLQSPRRANDPNSPANRALRVAAELGGGSDQQQQQAPHQQQVSSKPGDAASASSGAAQIPATRTKRRTKKTTVKRRKGATKRKPTDRKARELRASQQQQQSDDEEEEASSDDGVSDSE